MSSKADIKTLVEQCEQQELEAPGGVATAEVYGKLLVLYLLQNDLNNVRYLWKRIPSTVKTANPELGLIWEVGKHLWQKNFVAVYPALNQEWSDSIKPMMIQLQDSIRQRIFRLVGHAYTSIEADQFAAYTGLTVEEAIKGVVAEGWEYTSDNTMILPNKPVSDKELPVPSDQHLAQLTGFVSFLEN